MSLSKKLCLRSVLQNSHSFSDCLVNKFDSKEDNYRRDSFCDRFCDDLSEVILQYLSLEDKLRLQCVSKQFQRTVFKRQYDLFIHMSDPEISELNLYGIRSNLNIRRDYYYFKVQSLDSFKALLKKCPNITSIELDGQDLTYTNHNYSDKINEVFQLIIENCNNLNEFISMIETQTDITFEEFHRKLAPKIKYYSYLRYNFDLIESTPFRNIEKIVFQYLKDESIVYSQLKLVKLKELELICSRGEEHMLQTVIDTFPTLTHFSVNISSENINTIYKPLKNISNLKHLIHFKLQIGLGFSNNNNRLNGLLKQMANNCQNLKSIDCRFIARQISDIRQFLSQLKAFPLKRLNLWLIFFNNKDSKDIDVNQLFSFELFKGFENITHLSFQKNAVGHTMKESVLKEIDINLPKLQYLKVRNIFDTTPEGVTQMADILSRLSRLQTIELKFKTGIDFKPIEEQITKKCKKIRKIQIKNSDIY